MEFVQGGVTWSASVGFGAGLPFAVFGTSATRTRLRLVLIRPRTAGMAIRMLNSLNLGLVLLECNLEKYFLPGGLTLDWQSDFPIQMRVTTPGQL